MKPEKKRSPNLSDTVKTGIGKLSPLLGQAFSFLRTNTEKAESQFKEIFQTTSGQVREKAEETRRAVRLRMAVLELEHHLNRLYPQIGKTVCDLVEAGKKSVLSDPDLKARLELAAEYHRRLEELKEEQVALHKREADDPETEEQG